MSIFLRAAELNEETTRCLQEFPKEMIFHLSSLHLLESVGQGTKECENVCCILTMFTSSVNRSTVWMLAVREIKEPFQLCSTIKVWKLYALIVFSSDQFFTSCMPYLTKMQSRHFCQKTIVELSCPVNHTRKAYHCEHCTLSVPIIVYKS